MRKCIGLFLVLTVIFVLAECGNSDSTSGRTSKQPAGVNDVLEERIKEEENKTAEANGKNAESTAKAEDNNVKEAAEAVSKETDGTARAADNTAGLEKNAGQIVNTEKVSEPEPVKEDEKTKTASNSTETMDIDVDLTTMSSTMVYSEVSNMMISPEDYIGKTIKMNGSFAYFHDEAADNYYFACIIQDATACCAQGIEFVLAGDHSFPEDYPEVEEEISVVGIFDTYKEGDYTYCTLKNAEFV